MATFEQIEQQVTGLPLAEKMQLLKILVHDIDATLQQQARQQGVNELERVSVDYTTGKEEIRKVFWADISKK